MPNFLMKYSIEMSLEYCKTLNPSNCSSHKKKKTYPSSLKRKHEFMKENSADDAIRAKFTTDLE